MLEVMKSHVEQLAIHKPTRLLQDFYIYQRPGIVKSS